ncbi:MAG: AbrB/MazE/SpoVT family DNA-binding domain-containing protein [Candidatus Thorarchaeota archaeon]
MGGKMGTGELDERGRITIPKDIREKMGLKSGDRVRISARKDGVTVEKVIDLNKFIEELCGCITIKGDMDPLRLKEIWRTAP